MIGSYLKVPFFVKFFCVVGARGCEYILLRVIIERARRPSKGSKKQESQKKIQHFKLISYVRVTAALGEIDDNLTGCTERGGESY